MVWVDNSVQLLGFLLGNLRGNGVESWMLGLQAKQCVCVCVCVCVYAYITSHESKLVKNNCTMGISYKNNKVYPYNATKAFT
jgi:hypothetical protein